MEQVNSKGRIAFLLMVHADPDMAVRLCRRLAPHAVFVHVDAKAVDYPIERLRALDNVTVIDQRETVYWADFGMITATLAMIRAALATGEDWLRIVTISGADYPLRPLDELVALFRANPDAEYLAIVNSNSSPHLAKLVSRHWRMRPLVSVQALRRIPGLRRIEAFARRCFNALIKLRGRDFVAETGREAHFGSNWWGLTPDALRLVLDTVEREPRLLRTFATLWCPEEHFFQTILAPTPYGAKCWPVADKGGDTLYQAPLHLVYPTPTRAFGNSDADFALARDSGKFFGRKLTSANAVLLDRIDRELLHLDVPARD